MNESLASLFLIIISSTSQNNNVFWEICILILFFENTYILNSTTIEIFYSIRCHILKKYRM